MLGQIFLTSCLFMMTSCWRIDVSENNVAIQLSINVTLECRNHDDNNNNNLVKFKEITKLMILKRNPYNSWTSLAKVERDVPHADTSLRNFILTGNASNLSNSFIKLQFPFATEDAIGQFFCEVEGYYRGTNKVKHMVKTKTEPVVITQREATSQDILKVIHQLKQQNKTKNVIDHLFVLLQTMIDFRDKDFEKMSNLRDEDFEKMRNLYDKDTKKMSNLHDKEIEKMSNLYDKEIEKMSNLYDKEIEKMSNLHDKDIEKMSNLRDEDFEKMKNLHDKDFEKINNLLEKINNRTNQLTEYLNTTAQTIPTQPWPTGIYSLLQAGTECPHSWTFDWQLSSVRITTKPGANNNDKTSHPIHLWPDTLEHNKATDRHYVNIRMCTKGEEAEGPTWPKGSYCMQFYKGNRCPNGFSWSNIEVGRYNDGINKNVVVNYPYSDDDPTNYTDQLYCCRNDGDVNTPIELPTRSPFYLYRYGGTCQKVKGMEVSNEWIQLDTTSRDRRLYKCPDSDITPLKLYLCYYKPSV